MLKLKGGCSWTHHAACQNCMRSMQTCYLQLVQSQLHWAQKVETRYICSLLRVFTKWAKISKTQGCHQKGKAATSSRISDRMLHRVLKKHQHVHDLSKCCNLLKMDRCVQQAPKNALGKQSGAYCSSVYNHKAQIDALLTIVHSHSPGTQYRHDSSCGNYRFGWWVCLHTQTVPKDCTNAHYWCFKTIKQAGTHQRAQS